MIDRVITPYTCLFFILLIFVIVWYFCSDDQLEFEYQGLKELYADYMTEEDQSVMEPILNVVDHQHDHHIVNLGDETSVQMVEEIKETNNFDLLPEKVDMNFNIDLTPQIPDEFKQNFCYVRSATGKFESKGEQICKKTIQLIYGVPFKSARPNWLKNPMTNRNLEIDVFNEDLMLGIEYNSDIHYKYSAQFHGSYENFRSQVYRDELKKKLCQEKGVHLIIVPYNVEPTLIPLYIVYHLPEIIRKRVIESGLIDKINEQ